MNLTELTVNGFCEEVFSPSAVPGGGSVSALSGALGASLLGMVCNITVNKAAKKGIEPDYEVASAIVKTQQAQKQFLSLIDSDSAAFQKVMDAFRLPKQSDEEKETRKKAIEEAYKTATKPPLSIAQLASGLLDTAEVLMQKGDKNALSDVKVAIKMLNSAIMGGVYNVEINLDGISDQGFISHMKEQTLSLTSALDSRCTEILAKT